MKSNFITYLIKNRGILQQLILRDIYGRYKGSILGILWTAINPLMMLSVYALVFSQIFRRNGEAVGEDNPVTFAFNLFAGLIVFNIFSNAHQNHQH